jgi:hypothetical protein
VVLRQADVLLRNPALDVDSAFDCVDDARELGEKAV